MEILELVDIDGVLHAINSEDIILLTKDGEHTFITLKGASVILCTNYSYHLLFRKIFKIDSQTEEDPIPNAEIVEFPGGKKDE